MEDIIVKSDGGTYELLRVPSNDWVYADELLVQVCSACGFNPSIMTLKDSGGNELKKTINAGSTVFLWSCKGGESILPPSPPPQEVPRGFIITIGYKTLFKECRIYDASDLEFVLKRGCTIYGLDPQNHEVQAFDSYYMLFERKKVRYEPPPPDPEPIRGSLKVILPDGSIKTVLVKSTTRVPTVLHAICSKMEWNVSDYSIDDGGEESLVQFYRVYEIKKKSEDKK